MSKLKLTLLVVGMFVLISSAFVGYALNTNDSFDGSIILGRPNNNSITANITSNLGEEVYLVWGASSNNYSQKSIIVAALNSKPAVIIMNGLSANKTYYYRLFFKDSSIGAFKNTQEYSFQTPKTLGEDYTFVVQSDSHLLNKADKELYAASMQTIAGYKPDFMFDLGDTFLNDQDMDLNNPNSEKIIQTFFQQRSFFDIVTRSAPLFLTIGNHEGEYGNNLDGTNTNMTVLSTLARKTYYPNPKPDGFYSGNSQSESFVGQPENYYAFQWGDALYVSVDPYRYSSVDPYNDKDAWEWTLGKTQYDWFRKTLESSSAKYKFVFSHHAIGNLRGGAEIAKLYEWGGYDKNGAYLFDQKRPGWGKPIQQIMKDTGVTIFFQGHDHLFASENVDGVIYQTLPKPAEKIPDKQDNYAAYTSGATLMNSGFLKIDVTKENVKVDYYRNYFVSTGTQTGNTGIVYSYTVDENHQVNILKATTDNLSTYGNGSTSITGTKKKSANFTTQSSIKTKQISVAIDGKTVTFDVAPYLDLYGRTQVPIRFIAEELGCQVLWQENGQANTAIIKKGSKVIQLKIGVKTALVDGKSIVLDTAASLKEGRTFVPLRFISEVLGAEVEWDNLSYKIRITTVASSNTVSSINYNPKNTGEAFVFTIQADPHRDEKSDLALYQTALNNILADKPDFHLDLGDTFMSEKFTKTAAASEQRYLEDKAYFSKIMSTMPLFLVNGNHEGENGWERTSGTSDIANWASTNRLKYFPNLIPDQLYTGSSDGQGNYYAYNWGDALFVALDPFWFSTKKAQSDEDGWSYTLGKTQYDWLKKTLENSSAKYKFIFIHNLVGGFGKDARGGAEAAKFFEWGGYNFDGTYGFDQMRSGWGVPIHQLLVDNQVTAVFHGHDHFYAKQELDGIIYQLVPQPSHPGSEVRNAAEYSYIKGVFLPPAGHIRVSVSEEEVQVDYIKASLQSNENGTIADSYKIQ